jgi:hypothetical protein
MCSVSMPLEACSLSRKVYVRSQTLLASQRIVMMNLQGNESRVIVATRGRDSARIRFQSCELQIRLLLLWTDAL